MEHVHSSSPWSVGTKSLNEKANRPKQQSLIICSINGSKQDLLPSWNGGGGTKKQYSCQIQSNNNKYRLLPTDTKHSSQYVSIQANTEY